MMKRIQRCREQMNQEIRKKYWVPLEGRHKAGAWEALDAGYTESHRAYHTWEHVARLLEKLSEFSDLSTRSDIIAVSVFWHDVVTGHKTRMAVRVRIMKMSATAASCFANTRC